MRFDVEKSGVENAFERLRLSLVDRATFVLPLLLVPVAVVNFLQQFYSLSLIASLGAGVVAFNLISAKKGNPHKIHHVILLLILGMLTVLSLLQRGVNGAFWVPPTLVMFAIIFPKRYIHTFITLYALTVVLTGFATLDIDNAWRLAVSTAVTIAFLHIFLDVIYTLQRRLVEFAVKDELTGAYNRREMKERLQIAVDRTNRYNVPNSLLLVDLDHFKKINDSKGHATGDEVLRDLVRFIQGKIRRGDEVFRIGGEEFIVLLPDTPLDGGLAIAGKLLTGIRETALGSVEVTASFGIAELRNGESVEEWTERADKALYKAKNNGRDRIES